MKELENLKRVPRVTLKRKKPRLAICERVI